MFPHDGDFIRSKRSRLSQNGVGNSHFANVVQESSARNYVDFVRAQIPGPRDGDGKSSHAFRMAFGLCIFQVKRISQGFKRDVVGTFQVGHGAAKLLRPIGHQSSKFV